MCILKSVRCDMRITETSPAAVIPPLSGQKLSIALALADSIGESGSWSDDLFVPNVHGVLVSAKDLVYNDSAWAPPSQLQLVHPRMSHHTAQRVGVRSLVQAVLDPANASGSDWEAYGQTESLTDRLKGSVLHE